MGFFGAISLDSAALSFYLLGFFSPDSGLFNFTGLSLLAELPKDRMTKNSVYRLAKSGIFVWKGLFAT